MQNSKTFTLAVFIIALVVCLGLVRASDDNDHQTHDGELPKSSIFNAFYNLVDGETVESIKQVLSDATKKTIEKGGEFIGTQLDNIDKTLHNAGEFIETQLNSETVGNIKQVLKDATKKTMEKGGEFVEKNFNADTVGNIRQVLSEVTEKTLEKGGEYVDIGTQTLSSQYSKLSNSETLQKVKEMSSDVYDKTIDFVKHHLDIVPPSEQETNQHEEPIQPTNTQTDQIHVTEQSRQLTINPISQFTFSERMNFKRQDVQPR